MLKRMSLVEAIKSDIKNFVDSFTDGYKEALEAAAHGGKIGPNNLPFNLERFRTVNVFNNGTGEYEDVIVVDSPYLCGIKGCAIACATEATAIDGSKHYIIITDNHFKKMSEESKLFFIGHELGHIHYGHIEEATAAAAKGIKYKDYRNDDDEIAADLYGLNYVDKKTALKALEDSYNVLPFLARRKMLRELKVRLQAVKAA